jgi:hypothetical protein
VMLRTLTHRKHIVFAGICGARIVLHWGRLVVTRRQGRTAVHEYHESDKKPGCLEWAIIVAIVVVIVLAALVLLGPQQVAMCSGGPTQTPTHLAC